MELLEDQEVDSLGALEERIHRAAELVSRLRREVDAANAEREAIAQQKTAAEEKAGALAHEVEALRAERQQVRGRIEKLLAQIDSLGA